MTLYGECVGASASAAVRISELGGSGCELEAEGILSVFDEDFALWIGAVGPFAATALRKDPQHLSLHFKEPLDPKILDHFLAA